MEQYFLAKRRLFEMLPADAPGVINLDDPRGAEFAAVARGRSPTRSTRRPTFARAR